jgi:VIT1/CCC1 family predicted Fe2+/Mn2+ transporter
MTELAVLARAIELRKREERTIRMAEFGADMKEVRRELERAEREYERWMHGGDASLESNEYSAPTIQSGFFD